MNDNQIMERLISDLSMLKIRMDMISQFTLKGPDGKRDPNKAVMYMIQDPNNPEKHFHLDDEPTDVKMVWVIRCSGSMFLGADGNYRFVTNMRAIMKKEAEQKTGGTAIIVKSDLPTFETFQDAFAAYDLFWRKNNA